MKKLTFVLTLCLTFSLFAADQKKDHCEQLGRYFGAAQDATQIDQSCYETFKKSMEHSQYDFNEFENWEVLGVRNILFISQYVLNEDGEIVATVKRNMISGKQSRLKKVKAVRIAPYLKRVYAIEGSKKGAIFSYGLDWSGNMGPKRKLYDEGLDQATNLSIDEDRDEMYVLSSGHGWIRKYHLRADVDNKKPEYSTEVKAELSGKESGIVEPLDLVVSNVRNRIYVLDSKTKLLVFDRDLKNHGPIREVDVSEMGLISGRSLGLSREGVVIVDSNDKEFVVPYEDVTKEDTLAYN